jgi:hypothetical protein
MFIFGIGLCSVLIALRDGWALNRFILQKGWILVIVLTAPIALSLYKQNAYDARYLTSGSPIHPVWHAIYMGLSAHPQHNANGMFYSDSTACDASYLALLASPERGARLVPIVSRVDADSTALDVYPHCGWVKYVGRMDYEEFARAATVSFVARHPRYALESFLLYKPLAVVEQLQWQLGLREAFPSWWNLPSVYQPAQRDALDLFHVPALLAVIIAIACAYPYRSWAVARDWVLLSGGLFVASLVPSIIVAPIYYEMPVVFLTFCLAVYAGVGAGLLIASSVLTRVRSSGPETARQLRQAAS